MRAAATVWTSGGFPRRAHGARVRVTGVLVEADLVDVDAVTAERSAA